VRAAALVAVLLVGNAQAATLYDRAEEAYRQIDKQNTPESRYAKADEAADLARRVTEADPGNVDGWILWATALATTPKRGADSCRPVECAKAVEVLHQARAHTGAQPGSPTRGVGDRLLAGELALILSRLGRFAEAYAEYERALKLVPTGTEPSVSAANLVEDWRSSDSTLNGNAAESLMALGRLDESLVRYERAAELSGNGELSWELAQWGIGVAADRDGQIERSANAVQAALARDPAMWVLQSNESVFFEPPGDGDFYLGLGHAVAWRTWHAPLDRWLATVAMRRFLTHPSQYAGRAKAWLAILGDAKKPQRAPILIDIAPQLPTTLREPDSVYRYFIKHADDMQLCWARHPVDGLRSLMIDLGVAGRGDVFGQTAGPEGTAALSACLEKVMRQFRLEPLEIRRAQMLNTVDRYAVRLTFLP
jgi:tetratricopeptide (TPR) repeat protein